MKKVYSSIALAAAICGSASAAVVETANVQASQLVSNEIQAVTTLTPIEKTDDMYKKAASAKDVQGVYMWNWYGRTQDTSGLQSTGISIFIDGTDVTIMGFFDMAPITGTFNPSTGVIRIPTQPILYTGDGGQQIKLFTQELIVADGKITGEKNLPYIEFEYLPEGAKNQAGQTVLVGGWYTNPLNQFNFNIESNLGGNRGYGWSYGLEFHNTLEVYNISNFVYNEDEWTDCGNATLEDGWFKALDGQGFPAYNVNCKKNKENNSEILLMNPYGVDSPYAKNGPKAGINWNSAPSTPGFIVLDIANPDCVFVRPFTNSGFNIKHVYGFRENETSTTVSYPTDGYFYCTSAEGYKYYVEGWTAEDIIDEAEIYGDPLPSLQNKVVTLPNCRVMGPEEGYLFAAQWLSSDSRPIPMESKITLPDAVFAGVDGIINDADAAVKRYFNLQGVEIANPEAGQVVIVKEGNKATKAIF